MNIKMRYVVSGTRIRHKMAIRFGDLTALRNIILVFPLLLLACSNKPSSGTLNPQVTGGLTLQVGDSYHLSDSTANWQAVVNYRLVGAQAPYDSGSIIIPTGGQPGNIYRTSVDSLPSGGFIAIFSVQRPFVIIGRKDNISKARFTDSVQVIVPQYSSSDVQIVDIWAFHPDQLVVYFNRGIDELYADSLLQHFGVRILSRHQTFLDSTIFDVVSTEGVGFETDIKPQIEAAPGVRSVFFNIFGHSYF